jgi:hypothetical protein
MSINPDGCPFIAICKEYFHFKNGKCPKEKEKEFCMVYYDLKEQTRERQQDDLLDDSD